MNIELLKEQYAGFKSDFLIPLSLDFSGNEMEIGGNKFLSIGCVGNHLSEIVLAQNNDVVYFYYEHTQDMPLRFLNTTLEAMVKSFNSIEELHSKWASSGLNEDEKAFEARNVLMNIDSRSLGNPENYWSCYLEDIESGVI